MGATDSATFSPVWETGFRRQEHEAVARWWDRDESLLAVLTSNKLSDRIFCVFGKAWADFPTWVSRQPKTLKTKFSRSQAIVCGSQSMRPKKDAWPLRAVDQQFSYPVAFVLTQNGLGIPGFGQTDSRVIDQDGVDVFVKKRREASSFLLVTLQQKWRRVLELIHIAESVRWSFYRIMNWCKSPETVSARFILPAYKVPAYRFSKEDSMMPCIGHDESSIEAGPTERTLNEHWGYTMNGAAFLKDRMDEAVATIAPIDNRSKTIGKLARNSCPPPVEFGEADWGMLITLADPEREGGQTYIDIQLGTAKKFGDPMPTATIYRTIKRLKVLKLIEETGRIVDEQSNRSASAYCVTEAGIRMLATYVLQARILETAD